MKRVTLIGSTGSIGQSTLSVVEHLSEEFGIFALAAHSSMDRLADQVAAVGPEVVALTDPARLDEFYRECVSRGIPRPEVVTGAAGIEFVTSSPQVDIVVSAAVGAAGLLPTWSAVAAGKTVALANKEAMVVAGELLSTAAAKSGARILPIDSEHSAIDQCLRSGRPEEVARLILTASGGPFRDTPSSRFETVTPAEALNHPTWKMGRRITIDSATLMNKGLEVIEARWLFNVPAGRIDIVVHPQSVVHSMVEFMDGSVIAQLGVTDMRQPIQYALTYPDRRDSCVSRLDWSKISRLDFAPPDTQKFPCIGLAYRAIEMGGTAPAALNAADEVAVEAFLGGEIAFTDIPRIIEAALDHCGRSPAASLEQILAADRRTREFARDRVGRARIGTI